MIPRLLRKSRLGKKKQRQVRKRRSLHRRKRKHLRPRSRNQQGFTKKNGIKLGLMSFLIKAAVEALKAVPVVNGRIEEDDFIQNNFYDIGVAVGTERGLIVPIVRDADKKSFAELELDIAGYAVKAREGKLKIEDFQGG